MSYLPGDKLEDTARRQLQALGIDMSATGISNLVRQVARQGTQKQGLPAVGETSSTTTKTASTSTSAITEKDKIVNTEHKVGRIASPPPPLAEASLSSSSSSSSSWKQSLAQSIGTFIGVDNALYILGISQQVMFWSLSLTARTLQLASSILPSSWTAWSAQHVHAHQQARGLLQTKAWMDALMDVHGYQIFQQGLFNADCHPGNILVFQDEDEEDAGGKSASKSKRQRLGLIDYGQCKRLSPTEQARVGQLVLSVANHESDEVIADAFRNLGVKTVNDSTEFLAEMARLMFGKFQTQHMKHAYHKRLHQMDRITYFPNELSMVYRCALLLRGLAVSLQTNPSIAEEWREHAQIAVNRQPVALASTDTTMTSKQQQQQQPNRLGSSVTRRGLEKDKRLSPAL